MEGIGWYTHELMRRIVSNNPEHDFYFIFDRPYDNDFIYSKNVHAVIVPPPARHVYLIAYWFDIALKKALNKIQPDVFFSPDSINMLSPVCKTITTIHDVNFITNPKNFGLLLRKFYAKRTPVMAKHSERIVTVSEFSKNEISTLLHVPDEKIDVIYNACRPGFQVISDSEKSEIRSKYSNGNPFFIFIGGLYNRKNLIKLVEAFEIFKRKNKSEMFLLIVGKKVHEAKGLIKKIGDSEFSLSINLTGRINDDVEVKKILASAFALTYVSVLEGFGLPLVEAMNCGIPIITSNAGSLPEVAGKAALYADPRNAEDISSKMAELVNSEASRNELIQNAQIQAQKFDWDKSAEKLWEVIEKVINQK